MSPLLKEPCVGAWIYRHFFRRISQCPSHETLQVSCLRLRDEMPPKESFCAYTDRYQDHPLIPRRKDRNRPMARKSGARTTLAFCAEASGLWRIWVLRCAAAFLRPSICSYGPVLCRYPGRFNPAISLIWQQPTEAFAYVPEMNGI